MCIATEAYAIWEVFKIRINWKAYIVRNLKEEIVEYKTYRQ
jgi:hypothetical protein